MEENKSEQLMNDMVEKFVGDMQQNTNKEEITTLSNETELSIYRSIITDPVESSNIDSIGYLKESKILKVIFKGGAGYIYKNVDELQMKNINNAKSIGRYFNDNIKAFPDKYECIKL